MIEFFIFGVTLFGIALFHKKAMYVSLSGLTLTLLYKLFFIHDFSLEHHLAEEWRILLNLLGLLLGFGILSKHFEESHIPEKLSHYLPSDWRGSFLLLLIVFFMSSFLDNIAAAVIGGTIAHVLFKGKVHIAFLAAIVAAANAGGTGSVIGDTTTTLMWIDGVSPLKVLPAFIGSIGAFAFFSIFASIQQNKFQKIIKQDKGHLPIDAQKVLIIILILVLTVLANWRFDFPALGVWIAILVGSLITKTPWQEIKHTWQGTVFLMALVMTASLMPVDKLPPASWISTLSLGFISSIFDNIPLTKLCLDQGGYDWGLLAYAVGYGGSMTWFGSSAGVALSNLYPEMRSTVSYLKQGWFIIPSYVLGFFLMLLLVGWNP